MYYANKNWWVKGYDYFHQLKYQEIVTLDELRPYTYFFEKLDVFYINLGDYYNSAHALEMALELNPKIRIGWQNLGHSYRNAGAYDNALRAYKKVIEYGDKSSSIYSHIALIYEKKNSPKKVTVRIQDEIVILYFYT